MSVLNILATSHGTDSLEGRQAIALVRAELQKLLHERSTSDGREYKVHEAYVDVQTPSVDEAAQAYRMASLVLLCRFYCPQDFTPRLI